jgi:hypothetical protein
MSSAPIATFFALRTKSTELTQGGVAKARLAIKTIANSARVVSSSVRSSRRCGRLNIRIESRTLQHDTELQAAHCW